MALPLLLAGPILRRCEATRVVIWLATSEPASPRAEVFRFGSNGSLDPTPVGSGEAESIRLGERLFVHLISATPGADRFPTDELLAYDLALEPDGGAGPRDLRSLGLLDGPDGIVIGSLPLPTFFIRERTAALNVMHGSCRQLHGAGEDSFLSADEVLARTARDVAARPQALFLTGDQIYADDVAAPLAHHVGRLATELMGSGDDASVPGMPSMSRIPLDGRMELVAERAGFTSEKAHNHLMTFGEFAATYLCAWNADVWPTAWPAASAVVPSHDKSRAKALRRRRKYKVQRDNLERGHAALPSARRVLANVPTYMVFDDHDVTDDWNLTQSWREKVRKSPSGRRIVANALASFWAFQGWGNDPEAYPQSFKETVARHLSQPDHPDADRYDDALWSFDRWSFYAPTSPPSIALDTRTQRGYDSPDGGARLVGEQAFPRLLELASGAGHNRGDPLVIVSPVPVFGFEFQERRQKYLLDKLGPYEIDFEAWHSNLRGLVDLMKLLVEDLAPSWCLLLSGDVHYGVNARASFAIDDDELPVIQLVSSGMKHAGVLSKAALNSLGHLLRNKHERLGWDKPPQCESPKGLRRAIMFRAVNTDEWNDDSPVFLSPTDVKMLGIDAPPDFRECRLYIRPRGRNRSILVGENNIGVVAQDEREVTHRLLSRGKSKSHEHTASIGIDGREPA